MDIKKGIFFLSTCLVSLTGMAFSGQTASELKQELGIALHQENASHEGYCHLYFVHHGMTDWAVEGEKRLQGWSDTSLNKQGRKQIQALGKELSSVEFAAIYSSTLSRAAQSAEILGKDHYCEIIFDPDLRGESHGLLEGKTEEEYEKDAHFLQYKSLPMEEKLFFSVGEEGESKADVAKRFIPAIQEICKKHPGQNILIVTHGGNLKVLNFLIGNVSATDIQEVPYGKLLRIDSDGTNFINPVK